MLNGVIIAQTNEYNEFRKKYIYANDIAAVKRRHTYMTDYMPSKYVFNVQSNQHKHREHVDAKKMEQIRQILTTKSNPNDPTNFYTEIDAFMMSGEELIENVPYIKGNRVPSGDEGLPDSLLNTKTLPTNIIMNKQALDIKKFLANLNKEDEIADESSEMAESTEPPKAVGMGMRRRKNLKK